LKNPAREELLYPSQNQIILRSLSNRIMMV
jgi:hypothetical protein